VSIRCTVRVNNTTKWRVGDVLITKVVESESTIAAGGPALPNATVEEIRAIPWLRPTWLNDRDEFRTSVYSLLVETPTQRIVIDTGIGNDKRRAIAPWNHRHTDFLERFESVWPRESVDGVLCTHLHIDHVGWNTILVDGEWQPTFPNAKYHFVREEYEHWKAQADVPADESRYSLWAQSMIDGPAVYADSIKPIADAGLISFVTNDAVVSPEITLMPTAGHTPGHASVVIESGGERAVVTGDLFHFACQIARPDWSASLDHDQEASASTRRAFLTELADTQTLVLGTHFAHPTAGHVVSHADTFRFVS
jgi:glyoxylase-like metal-dependent hydrolase (beta-lactamase superfamily II)